MGQRHSAVSAVLAAVCICAAGATCSSDAAQSYLPRCSPTPLRFAITYSQTAPYFLPELPAETPDITPGEVSGPAQPAREPLFQFPRVSLWGTILDWNALAALFNPADSAAATQENNPLPALLEFFKPNAWRTYSRTNNTDVIVVPVQFTPPAINITPSSRATYRTE